MTLGLLSLVGIWSAMKLPVSLFPNSSRPQIEVCMPSQMAPDAFLQAYGRDVEEQLRSISADDLTVEKVTANYQPRQSCFETLFSWGNSPTRALREVQTVVAGISARLPAESRDRMQVYPNHDSGGFFALVFYSNKRSLDELYKELDPVLAPQLSKVKDAADAGLWNPQKKQLIVELKPEAMAAFGLFPSDVAGALQDGLASYGAGSISVGSDTLSVEFPRPAAGAEELKRMPVATGRGRSITLGDVARVETSVPIDSAKSFKTNGTPSLILFAQPKPGGNVKAMSEDVLKIVRKASANFPSDIGYKVLVDPSEFIRSATGNVGREVLIAALLAVAVLFLFVGNVRNVATAAVEIPISIVLAFMLMRIAGVNINLISLGGLALSAGMNVDASVVVMENIFRVFEEAQARGERLDFEARVRLVVGAVQEVKFAVIASTIASLVVFLPLAFTSDLSYALLGDLAKAVVFSHGFSAAVALVLVPTIRLQLLGDRPVHEKPAPLDGVLRRLEDLYGKSLAWFLAQPRAQLAAGIGLVAALALVIGVVLPRLPREVVGKPDTDWVVLGVVTRGNTLNRQMDAQTDIVERDLLKKFGSRILYTFVQVNRPNQATIMARLRDRRDMTAIWKDIEGAFPNTPFTTYWVDSWNPAELPIPNPPDFKVSVRGSDPESLALTARALSDALNEKKIFPWIKAEPNVSREEGIFVRPRIEVWPKLAQAGARFTAADLADLARTALAPRYVSRFSQNGEDMEAYLHYPEGWVSTPEELGALPVGLGSRVVPLKALATVERLEMPAPISRENGREAFMLSARQAKGEEALIPQSVARATKEVDAMRAKIEAAPERTGHPKPAIEIENPAEELDAALWQLGSAAGLSIILIFATMVFQFGSVMNSLLVLVAIPLGIIGVGVSLFIFRSTLSLNSMLGVILLNGISVANSIILVDFLSRAVRAGGTPAQAAVDVGRKRLRPILMTSLTTALGMLPVAFGFGEGGKILQPLGIAVAGGLAFSMGTTLFIVPALQVAWLNRLARRRASAVHGEALGRAGFVTSALIACMALASSTARAAETPDIDSAPAPAAPPARAAAAAETSPTEKATVTPSPTAASTQQTAPAVAPPPANPTAIENAKAPPPGLPPPIPRAGEERPAAASASASPAPAPAAPDAPKPKPAPVAAERTGPKSQSPESVVLPKPGDDVELGFTDAYRAILNRSLRIETQAAQIDVARSQALRAAGQFAPSVSAQTTQIQDITTWNRRTAYLTAKLNVFKAGADLENLRGAREQVRRERFQLEVERQNAEDEATAALVGAIGQTLLRDIAAQLAASNAEINQVARQRFDKGLMPAQEAEKARVELENARARLNDAETQLATARANLRVLLGRSRVRPLWPWKAEIARDAAQGPETGLADAPFEMRKRPDWRAADRQAEADSRRARSAWRGLLPSLDLQANYGTEDMSDPGRRDWSVYVTMSINLFDQGQTIGTAQERTATATQSQYRKEAIERRADADIEIGRQSHRIAARSAVAREKSLESARALLDDSEKRFRMGRATVNDLAQDQKRFADSQQLAIDGWSQAHLSLMRLCHVLGGRVQASGNCKRPD